MSYSNLRDGPESRVAAEEAERLESKSQVQSLHQDPPSDLPPSPATSPLVQERLSTVLRTLQEACISGDLVRVQSILAEHGEALHDRDNFASTLSFSLELAAKRGHAEVVSYLLAYGAEMEGAPIRAMQHKDTDTVIRVFEVLFSYGLDLEDFPGFITTNTVVGNETLLQYLLSKGADPNALDDFDNIPLGLCSSSAAIGILIDAGADISRANLLHNATHISDDRECIERMEFVLGKGVDINARALYPGYAEPGSRAYNAGMRFTGNEGTALHWAVRGFKTRPEVNKVPRVKWLLERGADKDIQDNTGLKPIDYTSDQEIISLFSNKDCS